MKIYGICASASASVFVQMYLSISSFEFDFLYPQRGRRWEGVCGPASVPFSC